MLRDETGNVVRLGQYFNHGKPVLLNFMYYRCPMLCPMVMDGVTNALTELRFDIGKEFDVVTVSIDPRDTPEQAAMKKTQYVNRYGRFGAANGWHFLTGPESAIKQLTEHRRIPIRVRHQDRPVRARRGAARRHAAGPRLALPLRLRRTSRAISASPSSKPRPARSAPPPTPSFSSATTTIRPRAATAAAR